MLVCPHCNQAIEMNTPKDVPWWKYKPMDRGVSLGCGTLIIIAIIVAVIVAVFSGNDDLSSLSRKVDELTVLVEEIHTSVTETP